MTKRTLMIHGGTILIIVLIGFGPLLIALGAGAFASLNGCTLHEGFVKPCVVLGVDWGETLYSMGVMGWITILSVPVAVMMFAIYAGVMLVRWFTSRGKNAEANSD